MFFVFIMRFLNLNLNFESGGDCYFLFEICISTGSVIYVGTLFLSPINSEIMHLTYSTQMFTI